MANPYEEEFEEDLEDYDDEDDDEEKVESEDSDLPKNYTGSGNSDNTRKLSLGEFDNADEEEEEELEDEPRPKIKKIIREEEEEEIQPAPKPKRVMPPQGPDGKFLKTRKDPPREQVGEKLNKVQTPQAQPQYVAVPRAVSVTEQLNNIYDDIQEMKQVLRILFESFVQIGKNENEEKK